MTQGIVEFDGRVAIDCHHEGTPDVYLEMLITAPDSREYESLVVADIKPSNLHAALLAAGFEPGAPMTIDEDGTRTPASGDELIIELIVADQDPVRIESWVVRAEAQTPLTADPSWNKLVFAGSTLTDRGYAADADGTLAALTPFTTEVIAPAWTLSHHAEIDEPVWIANRDLVPEQGAGVRVRITSVKENQHEDDESHQP
ncbi:MAG: hypothetical protein KC996_06605 [Phycisphaerales bacterium]|nr:hypothetical protein [Phycisphaerales bacterium]